jgi:DNA-binding MarR family transcriptional regulator
VAQLESELGVLLRRARAISAMIAHEVHPDVEPAVYGLLVRLAKTGGARVTDLAGYFGVGKSTVSRQLAGLEELGLVERVPDPDDARAAEVRLTAEGARRLDRAQSARRDRFRAELAEWPERDVRQLAALLRRYNERGM